MDQAGILSTVHHSHAAFTDLLENLVMANGLTDHAIPLTQCSWAQWYAWGVLKAMEKARVEESWEW